MLCHACCRFIMVWLENYNLVYTRIFVGALFFLSVLVFRPHGDVFIFIKVYEHASQSGLKPQYVRFLQ